jgi:uncharacterized surface protein with fasciclin (FAS1) repeats
MELIMTRTLGVFGIGVLSFGILACSSSASPVAPSTTGGAAAGSAALTIVEIVLQPDGEFDVLQAAVTRAGLVEVLNGPGQYTVFAPTDMAFVKTLNVADEAAAIAAVNGLPVETLKDILLYHVTSGLQNSTSVLAASSYQMLNGDELTRADLTAAGIATTDLSASNGIVHVINSVLLPS